MALSPAILAAQQAYAAQQAASGTRRGVTVSPVAVAKARAAQAKTQQTQATQQAGMSRTALIRQQMGKTQGPQQDPGFLGSILGNSIVKGVLKPLEAFDVPRRLIISGIQEGVDALGGGDASWSDFTEQAKDSSFGFGDVIGDTGNQWLNRFIGLAGDIAFDPLTYMTLGAGKLAGAGGRVDLAVAGAERGLADELISKGAKYGENALTQAEREAFGLSGKAGVQFKVPFGKEYRIPGTEQIARGGSKMVNAARLPFTDTGLGRVARKMGAGRDQELRGMVEALAKGGTDEFSATTAANRIRQVHAQRRAASYLAEAAGRSALEVGANRRGDDAFTHAYEAGLVADQDAGAIDQIQGFLLKQQQEQNMNIGDLTAMEGGPAKYLPHIYLPEAGEYLTVKHDLPGFGAADPAAAGSQQYARAIVPGKRFTIDGKVFEPKVGSIEEINGWSRANLGVKLLEDDPEYLVARMVEDASEAYGRAAGINELKTGSQGVFSSTDPTASRPLAAANEARAAEVEGTIEQLSKQGLGQRAQAEQLGGMIQNRVLNKADEVLGQVKGLDKEAKDALTAIGKEVGDLEGQQGRLEQMARQLYEQAETRRAQAQSALEAAEERVRVLKRQVGTDRRSVYTQALTAETKRRDQLVRELADATEVARKREIVQGLVGRAQERNLAAAGVQQAAEGALPGRLEDIASREATELRSATAAPPLPVQRADPIQGPLVLGNQAAKDEWDRLQQVMDDLRGQYHAEQLPKMKERILKQMLGAKVAQDDLVVRESANPRAIPVPSQKAQAAARAKLPKPEDVAKQFGAERAVAEGEVVGAQAAREAALQKRLAMERKAAPIEERFATQEAARGELAVPFDEAVGKRMEPFEEQVAKQTEETGAVYEAAKRARQQADDAYEQLPEAIQGDMEPVALALSDAKGQQAMATADANAAADAVKAAKSRVKETKAINSVPGQRSGYDVVEQQLRAAAQGDLDQGTMALLDTYGRMVASMAKTDADIALNKKWLEAIRKGEMDPIFHQVANDGFQTFPTSNLINGQDSFVSKEMFRAMTNFKRASKQDPGMLGKVIDNYTKFFKNWATATPGFHIRNAISATIMNLTEGVTFKEMLDGGKIWQAYRKNPMGDWVTTLPAHLQPHAMDVVKSVYGSGAGGRFTAAELGNRAFGERGKPSPLSKASDNFITKRSHNLGERVEGVVRAGLALNEIKNGSGRVARATARISRVHFNYSEVNEWDESLRRVIPFWTFMSRNIPLQVQQMWLKPRTYAHYESLKRNFNVDPEGSLAMPDYLREQGAFRITDNLALSPDIGSNQLFSAIETLANPRKALSTINPGFQVPLQLATNQDFFYGGQYKDNDFQKPGWELGPLMPLLASIGLAEKTEGGYAIERKYQDAVRDLIPFLGTLNRTAATTADREGKEWQGVANFLGVPIKQIPADQAEKDLMRRRRESTRPDPNEARQRALAEFARAG